MFELKLLNQWMQDYEESIYDRFIRTAKVARAWYQALKEQKTLIVNDYNNTGVKIPELSQFCYYKISPDWEKREFEATYSYFNPGEGWKRTTRNIVAIVQYIQFEGDRVADLVYCQGGYEVKRCKAYMENLSCTDGLATVITKADCLMSEVDWCLNHTETQMRERAHKMMLQQKQVIEKKVEKICGKELTNIDDNRGEIFAKGSNGRVAHIWAIEAGGYNIQCRHIRVLVKEVK